MVVIVFTGGARGCSVLLGEGVKSLEEPEGAPWAVGKTTYIAWLGAKPEKRRAPKGRLSIARSGGEGGHLSTPLPSKNSTNGTPGKRRTRQGGLSIARSVEGGGGYTLLPSGKTAKSCCCVWPLPEKSTPKTGGLL